MTVTEISSERILAGIQALCHSNLDFDALAREAASRLKRAVPFEGYAVVALDPLSVLPTDFVFSEEMGSEEDAEFFIENIYFEDDILEYGWMARNRIPAMTLAEATNGKLERALRYREYNGPKGFGHGARAVLSANGRPWGGLCLVREKGDPDFDERELSFLARLSPHLGAGLRDAALRDAALRREPHLEPSGDTAGILVLDYEGRVTRRTAAADSLLRELGASRRGLPTAVWAIVGALRRTPRNSAPRLCVSGRSGRWISLQASLTEPDNGHPPETAVVIALAGPREVARLHADAHGLSEREKQVVSLVLRGASTRDISHSLYIAESTVQGHLSHVFDKLGVKSRRELLKRLCLDSMQPTL